jgi:hypothetical protein
MLTMASDPTLLQSILDGYKTDPFCAKLSNTYKSIDGVQWQASLLYIGDHLVIPHIGSLCEDLFHLVHDSLGHFEFEKSYSTLHNDYYWPKMCRDLSEAYIPACIECQCDKS